VSESWARTSTTPIRLHGLDVDRMNGCDVIRQLPKTVYRSNCSTTANLQRDIGEDLYGQRQLVIYSMQTARLIGIPVCIVSGYGSNALALASNSAISPYSRMLSHSTVTAGEQQIVNRKHCGCY
jgi:hypothetical protein